MWFKIVLLLVIVVLSYIATPTLLGKNGNWQRWVLIILHGLLLTILLLFFSNSPELILSDQINLMQQGQLVRKGPISAAKTFINDHILCIDISGDKIQHESIDPRTKVVITDNITDRSKLIVLMDSLKNNLSDIDLVVLDIDLDIWTDKDCILSEKISELNDSGKILCSSSGPVRDDSCMHLPLSVYGNVVEATNKELFSSHEIFKNESYSLGYRIYARLRHLKTENLLLGKILSEVDSNNRMHLGVNTFIPQLYISDSSFIPNAGVDPGVLSDVNENGTQFKTLLYRQLRDLSNPIGMGFFIKDLKSRKMNGKQNIILIGQFAGPEDLHRTSYGKQHGITIVMNIAYGLLQQDHILRSWAIFGLWIGFTIISWFTIYNKLRDISFESTVGMLPARLRNKLNKIDGYIIEAKSRHIGFNRYWDFASAIWDLLIGQMHILLLLLMVVLIYYKSNTLVNGISFLIYFIFLSRFLSVFFKHYKA